MCSDSVHLPAISPQPDPCVAFLADAWQNLAIVGETFGEQSGRYQRLVDHYRLTSDALECRLRLEQVLASLVPPSQTSL